MPPDVTKSLKITFSQHLPMGTMGTFTHEKQTWIAYPAPKNQAIHALCDRLIGIHAGITKDMISWLNRRPNDAELITMVLERTALARKLTNELIIEKGDTFTS